MADLVGEGRGKVYFDKFRGQIATFRDREQKLLDERVALAGLATDIEVLRETSEWINHTHLVIEEAMKIEAAGADMETGMRGYLLAGKDEFLNPYKAGNSHFKDLVANLKTTVSDNPAQVSLLGEIEDTIGQWQTNVTEPTIALRREIGDAQTMNDMADLVGEARGKAYFDKFRDQIKTFRDREIALMTERQIPYFLSHYCRGNQDCQYGQLHHYHWCCSYHCHFPYCCFDNGHFHHGKIQGNFRRSEVIFRT